MVENRNENILIFDRLIIYVCKNFVYCVLTSETFHTFSVSEPMLF